MANSDKTWGVTPPISSNLPTPADRQASQALLDELRNQNQFETAAETAKRDQIIEALRDVADEFVRRVAREREPTNEVLIRDARGEIFTYGSYCLGVYGPGSDIDTLVTAPRYVTREDYFRHFPSLLKEMSPKGAITDLTPVEDAFVPIIKFEYWGISIDLIFSRIATLNQFPPRKELKLTNNEYLRGLDDRELRSLNGNRVTEEILHLVPEQSTFRLALRAIKLWAQRRAIYANIIGFPGGVVWAMMVARTCQLYPMAAASTIVTKFFHIMKIWRWPEPVQLKHFDDGPLNVRVWNPKVYRSDKYHLMPVITPAYPQMCATFNITHSTKAIIQRELERGSVIVEDIQLKKRPWKDLFTKHTFFTADHKYYLAVIATSTTKEAHKIWSGFVESKVRVLVGDVERHTSIAIARPFNKGYERRHKIENDDQLDDIQNGSFKYEVKGDDDSEDEQTIKEEDDAKTDTEVKVKSETDGENGLHSIPDIKPESDDDSVNMDDIPLISGPSKIYTTTHYIGLELAEGAKSLDLSFQVNNFKTMCSEWEKYKRRLNFLSIQHVKNTNLPDDVFEPGETKPKPPLKAGRKRNAPNEGGAPPAKRQQPSTTNSIAAAG